MKIFPKRIDSNAKAVVIAPSRSLAVISDAIIDTAKSKIEASGISVTFAKNVKKSGLFNVASVDERLSDIHTAFKRTDTSIIMTAIGGYNSNQILSRLDYELIKTSPKILIGFSDITALLNAIYAKTGLVTYMGPHFSSWGMKRGFDYTEALFKKCLTDSQPFELLPSPDYSDDTWYLDQDKRTMRKNQGYKVITAGEAKGTLIGGNLCTFSTLQGTEFWPIKSRNDYVLCLEVSGASLPQEFDRDLQSIVDQPTFSQVKGVIIGKFQDATDMDELTLRSIIESKQALNAIPVVSGVNLGHCTPIATLPIGGTMSINAKNGKARIIIEEH